MHLRSFMTLILCAGLLVAAGMGRQTVFSQTGQAKAGAIGYAKARVRRTNIMFPRVTRFRDAKIMREVNRQIDEVTQEFNCDGQGGRGSYYRVKSRVAYAQNDIFSIYASAEYYCNTAYPTNDYNVSQTYDMRTGKRVEFEELFRDYQADGRAILKIIFAEDIARSEKLAASGKPREQTCEGDPELYSLERLEGSSYAFNFSSQGLQVQPQWPHVIEACAKIVTVPYDKLAPYAAPNGLLARVAKKQ